MVDIFGEEEEVVVSTGIPGLDVQLGGGIPKGTTLLLIAEPGAGADVFAQQFTRGGLIADEKVLYFAAEHPPDEIKGDMQRFGWNMEKYEIEGDLEFIDAYTPRFHSILPEEVKNNLSAKEFLKQGVDSLNLLKSVVEEHREEQHRVVIDSISYFLRNYDMDNVVNIVEAMSSIAKHTGSIQLLLMTGGMHDMATETTLKHVADGVVEFLVRERGSELERLIIIRKMRGMLVPSKMISYELTDKGIELETTTRVL